MSAEIDYMVDPPTGTPKAIVDSLNKEINAVLHPPALQERVAKNAAETYNWSPEEYKKFVVGEIDRYREVVRK